MFSTESTSRLRLHCAVRFMVWACFLILVSCATRANNIRVANVGMIKKDPIAKTASVVFDLSWDNSWKDSVGRDAAWVFVKFKAPGSNTWEHAILDNKKPAHMPAANCTIDTVPDGGGVFVYSAINRAGTVSYPKMKLCWQYGSNGYDFARGAAVEVSVQAIEMVYIPEGPFYVGSGGSERCHLYKYTDGVQTTEPYYVTSEAAINWGKSNGSLYASTNGATTQLYPGDDGAGAIISNAFPKGYAAFYCMKYELSQGQYTDFLNMLTTTQATKNYPNKFGVHNYSISKLVDNTYAVSAPDRACNWMQVAFGNTYADWAALRPMTELEYEKTCRGPSAPLPGEYAWGTTTAVLLTSVSGTNGSGTETPLPANANYTRLNAYPTRCGIFATSGSTRAAAGAGYYGVLDLTGNVYEQAVSVGYSSGRAFTGLHGDGILTAAGDANVSGWTGEDSGRGTIKRGGGGGVDMDGEAGFLCMSARGATYSNGDRGYNSGWRAVRTAP